ncbi:hypothetical protein WA588_001636, partial [Blastocystis sp. NMH]
MGKKIVFGDDDEALPLAPQEAEENATKVAASEDASTVPSRPSAPKRYDSSDDSDDAPEEVSATNSKSRTLEMYEAQKKAALQSKRRKRKQRVPKEEDELDASTLALLAENTEALSAPSTADNVPPESKRIHLETRSKNLTDNVETNVDGFKLVSLAKDANAKVGKKINPSVLEFQRAHFYGKNSNRVSAASFMR